MTNISLPVCAILILAVPAHSPATKEKPTGKATTVCRDKLQKPFQPRTPNKFVNAATGIDSGSCGSSKNPCHSIGTALASAAAKDVIEVAAGDYEPFSFLSSRIEDDDIQILGQSKNGHKPTIISQASNLVSVRAKGLVFSGFELTNGPDFIKKCAAYEQSDSHCTSGSTGITVLSGSRDITIANNDLDFIGMNYQLACGKKETDIRRCWGDSHGISIQNTGDWITNVNIIHNHISRLHLGTSEAISISGNVKEFLVQDNIISDLDNIAIDIIGKWLDCFDATNPQCQAQDGTVADNKVSGVFATLTIGDGHFNPGQEDKDGAPITMGAIYVDGGKHVVIERNVVHRSAMGIDVGSERGADISDVVARNNLIYDCDSAGIKIGGAGSVDHASVFNNTLVNNNHQGNDTGSIYFQLGSVFTNTSIVNNIVTDNRERWLVSNVFDKRCNNGVEPFDVCFTNNAFYSPNKDKFYNNSPHFDHRPFSSFLERFGDHAGVFSPLEMDSATYHLSKGSAAIDTGSGNAFPNCPSDACCLDNERQPRVKGKMIDIGAFEYNS